MKKKDETWIWIGLGLVALYLWGNSNSATLADQEGEFPSTPPASPANAIEGAWNQLFPMSLSSAGAAFIQQNEGLRLTAYGDAGGYSIGYGHRITGNESAIIGINLGAGSTITQGQALALFNADTAAAAAVVNANVSVPLSQGQFDSLVDFVFNEGAGAFESSSLLADLNSGNYDAASQDFAAWNQSGGRVSAGLVARRVADAALFNQATTTTAAA